MKLLTLSVRVVVLVGLLVPIVIVVGIIAVALFIQLSLRCCWSFPFYSWKGITASFGKQ